MKLMLIVLLLIAGPAFASPRASESDIQSCTPDAMRLCKAEIDRHDFDAAGRCMFAHRAALSSSCRAVLDRAQVAAKTKAKGKNNKRPNIAIRAPIVVPLPKPKPEEIKEPPAVIAPVIEPEPAPSPDPIIAPPPSEPPVIVPAPEPIQTNPSPAIEPKPEGVKPMENIPGVPWIQANLALVLVAGFIIFYATKNGGPSVLAWFKRVWGYIAGAAITVEKDVAGFIPALKADIAKLEARIAALEGKPPTPPASA